MGGEASECGAGGEASNCSAGGEALSGGAAVRRLAAVPAARRVGAMRGAWRQLGQLMQAEGRRCVGGIVVTCGTYQRGGRLPAVPGPHRPPPPASSSCVEIALRASVDGAWVVCGSDHYLVKRLEAEACAALLAALLGAASRGRGLLAALACGACVRRLRLRLLATSLAIFGSSRVAESVLTVGLSVG